MFWQTVFKHFPVKGHFFFFFSLFMPSQHITFSIFLCKTYKLINTCTFMHGVLIEADLAHKKLVH